MANPPFPYPPGPEDVPEDFAAFTKRYKNQVGMVLASICVFLALYCALMFCCVAFVVYALVTLGQSGHGIAFLFKLVGLAFGALMLFYLLRNFVRFGGPQEKSGRTEITEAEHPTLFAFIDRVCDEVGSDQPRKVYVTADVNAYMTERLSLWSLFFPQPKDLVIGLGLVNAVNLSEFKAMLAHELGHFRQNSGWIYTVTYRGMRIMHDIVFGRDWLDELLDRAKRADRTHVVATFLTGFQGVMWLLKKLIQGMFFSIAFYEKGLARQMEYNADLVAVGAAGSDALVHLLYRLDFASEALHQSVADLRVAADHKMYTADLFHHQPLSGKYLRRVRKKPKFGDPPLPEASVHPGDHLIFTEDDRVDPKLQMWLDHPSHYDRERNAKHRYVECPIDTRSPWILFDDATELREKVTYRFNRAMLDMSKKADIYEAADVQRFIDDERTERTYDDRFHGIYDTRFIEPGEPEELERLVETERWDFQRVAHVHGGLYDDEVRVRGEHLKELDEEIGELFEALKLGGEFEFRDKEYDPEDGEDLLERSERERGQAWEWFNQLDRRVYLVHGQMAKQVDVALWKELKRRYRFQLRLQTIERDVRSWFGRIDRLFGRLASYREGEIPYDLFREINRALEKAHAAVRRHLIEARDVEMPAMKNVDEGAPLTRYLLDAKLVTSPERSYTRGGFRYGKFMNQLGEMFKKSNRLDFKSMGGILALQDRIAEQWFDQHPGLKPGGVAARPSARAPRATPAPVKRPPAR